MALLNFSNSDSENEKVCLLVYHQWPIFFCPPWKSQMRFVLLKGEFGILISWICYSPALFAHSSGHQNYQYLQSLSSIPPLVSRVEIHLTSHVPVIDKWTSEANQQWSTNGPYEKLKKFFPQPLRNVCFLVMSVVLGHWLSVPFATVPRNSVSSFDGISLVLINHFFDACGMCSESSESLAISGKVRRHA